MQKLLGITCFATVTNKLSQKKKKKKKKILCQNCELKYLLKVKSANHCSVIKKIVLAIKKKDLSMNLSIHLCKKQGWIGLLSQYPIK